MHRERCSHCRNPIRGLGTSRPAETDLEWFHRDCLVAVRASEQTDYRRLVESVGLPALIAPYVAPIPLTSAERRTTILSTDRE